MKKLIAAAAVIAAMLACTKNEQPESGSTTTNEGFKKGQQVTLTFSASYNNQDNAPQTKVTSEWNSSTSAVDFKWEEGDQVKVTVVGSSEDPAVFTLASGAGTSTATFTGTMPDGGTKYTVQYPVDDPDITAQTYSSTEAIPHGMMKFIGKGEYSVHAHTETLKAQNAVLKLNLWGNYAVSKIEVTNMTSSLKYTLNCEDAVTLDTTEESATPFFIIVPAESYKFRAEVTITDTGSGSSLATPPTDAIQNGVFTVGATNVLTTSSAKTFTAGEILNMDAKQVTFTKVYFSKGNLYYDKTVSPAAFKFEDTQYAYKTSYDANHVCRFRWAENSGNLSNDITSALSTSFSLTGTNDDVIFTNATQTTPRADFTVAGQTGVWRTLSNYVSGEWYYLLNTRKVTVGGVSKTSYGAGSVNGVKGLIILPDNWDGSVCSGFTYGKSKYSNGFTESTTPKWSEMESAGCVFLPDAGIRSGYGMYAIGTVACYWSSTPYNTNGAYCLHFDGTNIWSGSDNRYVSHSVRLVSAAQ